MKVNIKQKLKDLHGKPARFGLDPQTAELYQKCFSIVKSIDENVAKKFGAKIEEQLLIEKTLQDIITTSLMISPQGADKKEKQKDFKLLMLCSTKEEPDLDELSRKHIVERIWDSSYNNLICGRCEELLLPDKETEEEETKKQDTDKHQ